MPPKIQLLSYAEKCPSEHAHFRVSMNDIECWCQVQDSHNSLLTNDKFSCHEGGCSRDNSVLVVTTKPPEWLGSSSCLYLLQQILPAWVTRTSLGISQAQRPQHLLSGFLGCCRKV